jgi:uncharacterized Zn finger protein (UPF0148 family)
MRTDDQRIDDNLALRPDGSVVCVHCGSTVSGPNEEYLSRAIVSKLEMPQLGPQVREPSSVYTELLIGARLTVCPGCYTNLSVEVGPVTTPTHRRRELESNWTMPEVPNE